MTSALYRFRADFGRMGTLQGIFVAEKAEIDAAIGREVYFGEVLGKHSDVSVKLKEEHFRCLTDDPGFVEKFSEFECESGHNPLDYIEAED